MAADVEFTAWLGKKLTELNTDEGVFGSYIQGILDSDETTEEKNEALQSILSEIIDNENDITKACNEILEMWFKVKSKELPPAACSSEDVDVKLVKLLESQALTTVKQKEYTEEEKKIREAILSQYSQMTDDEEEAGDQNHAAGDTHKTQTNAKSGGGSDLEKNTNALAVQQAEKERREQARLESQRKKDKDKEDREKQRQQREEKKEKRKTQKGERRR